nr:metallophosphoesterase family protein [uncultured Macellibacteroides sp.]
MKGIFIFLLACLSLQLTAQQSTLRFNKQGTFKIVQFTDLHYSVEKQAESEAALTCIASVLDVEKPDLVVFTGDLVYSKPAKEGLNRILKSVVDRKLPFAVVWGNHDDEQDISRAELQSYVEQIPGCLGKKTEGIPGESNFILTIQPNEGKRASAILYFLDSHAYSALPLVKGYDWIKPGQINWYTDNSKRFTAGNDGKPLPALAFFHIPLPEYNLAASDENVHLMGYRFEKSCAPVLNTGLFTAMLEAGDVMGVFVGHDHDNDYVTDWKGIALGYGRFSGGNTEYNNLPEGNGARVILLKENERDLTTWIRLRSGEKQQSIQLSKLIKPIKKD